MASPFAVPAGALPPRTARQPRFQSNKPRDEARAYQYQT